MVFKAYIHLESGKTRTREGKTMNELESELSNFEAPGDMLGYIEIYDDDHLVESRRGTNESGNRLSKLDEYH